jgi:hypothetical protein
MFLVCPSSRSRRFRYTNFVSNYNKAMATSSQLNILDMPFSVRFTMVLVTSVRHFIVSLTGFEFSYFFGVACVRPIVPTLLIAYCTLHFLEKKRTFVCGFFLNRYSCARFKNSTAICEDILKSVIFFFLS